MVFIPLGATFYIPKQSMAHVASLDDKLESIMGNKNIRVALLAHDLESILDTSSAVSQTTNKQTEIKSILQFRSNLTDNEIVLLIDGLGHKVAAYPSKVSLSINTQERSFSILQSFKDALAGKFGSMAETINGNKVIVSYHLIKNHSNDWVILLLQSYDKIVDEQKQRDNYNFGYPIWKKNKNT